MKHWQLVVAFVVAGGRIASAQPEPAPAPPGDPPADGAIVAVVGTTLAATTDAASTSSRSPARFRRSR